MKHKIEISIFERYDKEKLDYFRGFLHLIKIDFSWDWSGAYEQKYELEVDDYEYILVIQVLKLAQLHYENIKIKHLEENYD